MTTHTRRQGVLVMAPLAFRGEGSALDGHVLLDVPRPDGEGARAQARDVRLLQRAPSPSGRGHKRAVVCSLSAVPLRRGEGAGARRRRTRAGSGGRRLETGWKLCRTAIRTCFNDQPGGARVTGSSSSACDPSPSVRGHKHEAFVFFQRAPSPLVAGARMCDAGFLRGAPRRRGDGATARPVGFLRDTLRRRGEGTNVRRSCKPPRPLPSARCP